MSGRLLYRGSGPDSQSFLESQSHLNLDGVDFDSRFTKPWFWLHKVKPPREIFATFSRYCRLGPSGQSFYLPRARYCRYALIGLWCFLRAAGSAITVLSLLTFIFWPSYTYLPPHYQSLWASVLQSTAAGRGNPRNERVYIAASLYDPNGSVVGGEWGNSILKLIELLGDDNVFLSIYENGGDPGGKDALRDLESRVPCNKSIVFEKSLPVEEVDMVRTSCGQRRINRIGYLAKARNRALQPLDVQPEYRYDKLLYLNDVVFDPIDALQLLFSTNADENGTARYRSACAVDFINPFKLYDTFATRDLQGYGMGLPFYPWFSAAGRADSRNDVLSGTDAVRVRSCWGGMVAFDARFFQPMTKQPLGDQKRKSPIRFRASQEPYWISSECCLIQSDIQEAWQQPDEIVDTEIYLNPFVRVAYGRTTMSWLRTTRRLERLYTLVHGVGSSLAGLPRFNPRRTETRGSPRADSGVTGGDGFCSHQGQQVLTEHRGVNEKGWEHISFPFMKPASGRYLI